MSKNLEGNVTLTMPLSKNVLKSYVRTVPGNMHVKLEVRNFYRFGAISI